MASRLNPRTAEATRAKIQASQLINLLQDHALKVREIKPTQIECAKFLLSYALPKPAEQQQLTGELVITWKS